MPPSSQGFKVNASFCKRHIMGVLILWDRILNKVLYKVCIRKAVPKPV